ncbi:DNA polymerase [Bacillus wiedmannii]|uniref:DNA polymerase n=1 Tax=Bacillus wiedmannii TaxID=1890302 RepID=UPI000BF04C73|nr:DNA polymerase [Bacillus wiedmannii]PEM08522.1 DNA polymerase I [Bacillus wiedmannii]
MTKQMTLDITLELDDDVIEQKNAKIAEKEAKLKAKQYQPTMNEIWNVGYKTHTGTQKLGILQMKLSNSERQKLVMVKQAIEDGEIPVGVTDMKKFTKTHAGRLYTKLMEMRKAEIIRTMLETKPDNYYTIDTFEAFDSFMKDLLQEEEYAVDTETTGLNYFRDIIVGVSFTLPEKDIHVYIPINHTEGKQLPEEYVLGNLKKSLENKQQKKIMFNAKYDVHMFIRHGIYTENVYFDGMIAMKLLSENEPSYALKNLATKYGRYFGFEDKSATYETLFGKGGFQDTPIDIGSVYACKDTHLTYKFYKDFVMKHFDRLPKLKKLYFEIERPITDICVQMEQNGFAVDKDFAVQYGEELRADISGLEREMKPFFGDINLNSGPQMQEVLYDKLKLKDVSGKRKVDAKTLKKLASECEGIKILLKYRELTKLLGTYVEPFASLLEADGRLHGQFHQVKAATGRFASSGPNLQNLPARARKMIRPGEGMVIIGADFSQIEPRILSHLSGDEDMIAAYVEGRDLYIEMAMKVFKLERKYCEDGEYDPTGTFQPRKAVKSVLLGIMYGMGAKTLSENVKVSVEMANQFINDFFAAYPKVKAFIDKVHVFVEENEYVETMYNRKRRFVGHKQMAKRYHKVCEQIIERIGHIPDFIWGDEVTLPYWIKQEYWDVAGKYHAVCRQGVNTIIQGSAADVMKLAMIAVYEICKKYGYKILATIHDEILIEVPKDIEEDKVTEIENAMLSVVSLSVPMKCDTAFSEKRWGDDVGKKDWYEGKRF